MLQLPSPCGPALSGPQRREQKRTMLEQSVCAGTPAGPSGRAPRRLARHAPRSPSRDHTCDPRCTEGRIGLSVLYLLAWHSAVRCSCMAHSNEHSRAYSWSHVLAQQAARALFEIFPWETQQAQRWDRMRRCAAQLQNPPAPACRQPHKSEGTSGRGLTRVDFPEQNAPVGASHG